jgi:sulfur-oxidizing protein SoxB
MNLSKREFLQVLGAGTMAGHGVERSMHMPMTAKAETGLYDIARFGTVSFCT